MAQVMIAQKHHIIGKTVHGNVVDAVRLTADAEIEWMPDIAKKKAKIVMTVVTPCLLYTSRCNESNFY